MEDNSIFFNLNHFPFTKKYDIISRMKFEVIYNEQTK